MSDEGMAFCVAESERMADIWKNPAKWATAPRSILVALTIHHFTPEERAAALQDKRLLHGLQNSSRWAKVRDTWEPETIWAFFKSQVSSALHTKKVDITVKGRRHVSCSGRTLE